MKFILHLGNIYRLTYLYVLFILYNDNNLGYCLFNIYLVTWTYKSVHIS